MKISISSCALVCFLILPKVSLFALDSTSLKTKDTIKTGWNFGILPAIAFDTDLGFQYGGVVNAFYYGDGSRFPKYDHSLYFEISNTTRGSGINRFFYDSDKLLKNLRLSVDISYLNDQAMYFYGFNGRQSIYNEAFVDNNSADYKTRMFYSYKRNLFRFEPLLQGKILPNLKWITGFGIYNYDIRKVDLDRLNKGKTRNDSLPDVDGLYDKYAMWGIIPQNEVSGGWFNHALLGLAYDCRDNESNPMRGFRDEVLVGVAPKVFGNKSNSVKISLVHRHYILLVPRKLSFCYRVLWQTNVGSMPWYAKQLLLKSFPTGAYSEGMGGSKTVRGVLRYRLVGEDFACANIEFRYIFARTQFIKQNFQFAINPFYDAGIVTRFSPIDVTNVLKAEVNSYFSEIKRDVLHQSGGLGFRVIMNQNFIVAFEYGKAFHKQDGNSGFYINLNYLF